MKRNTSDFKLCDICGKQQATETHHLIFGTANRALCDEDEPTKIDICRECHKNIHYNGTAEKLSKMLGQALWERWYLSDFGCADSSESCARKSFMERYGRNYL